MLGAVDSFGEGQLPLAWTWLLLLGTFLTFATGWILGQKAESAA